MGNARVEYTRSCKDVLKGAKMVSLKIVGRGLTYAVVLVVSMVGLTVSAAERRPMALHVMLDGLRADAVESGQMPNLAKLRAGTW